MASITAQYLRSFLINPTLDSVTDQRFSVRISVRFLSRQGTTLGEVVLYVYEDATFDVASSSTAATLNFLEVADAYSRAAAFIRAAGLTPA